MCKKGRVGVFGSARKRTFRFAEKNASFQKGRTFRFADYNYKKCTPLCVERCTSDSVFFCSLVYIHELQKSMTMKIFRNLLLDFFFHLFQGPT